jgi:hypothetical protein
MRWSHSAPSAPPCRQHWLPGDFRSGFQIYMRLLRGFELKFRQRSHSDTNCQRDKLSAFQGQPPFFALVYSSFVKRGLEDQKDRILPLSKPFNIKWDTLVLAGSGAREEEIERLYGVATTSISPCWSVTSTRTESFRRSKNRSTEALWLRRPLIQSCGMPFGK